VRFVPHLPANARVADFPRLRLLVVRDVRIARLGKYRAGGRGSLRLGWARDDAEREQERNAQSSCEVCELLGQTCSNYSDSHGADYSTIIAGCANLFPFTDAKPGICAGFCKIWIFAMLGIYLLLTLRDFTADALRAKVADAEGEYLELSAFSAGSAVE